MNITSYDFQHLNYYNNQNIKTKLWRIQVVDWVSFKEKLQERGHKGKIFSFNAGKKALEMTHTDIVNVPIGDISEDLVVCS